ncbi:dethiobiotin synthase [Natroniella acetigena]|uniref:dethiobiotin synthase n=1 Tax=Natroniella acetigena TaxID=52004 RepID=UPI00200A5EF8|nr:dethiobiotin synthase [Natroniella acetigena]MCK8827444.1 dethiobiotin synthase [Natroniella acetigena]
MRNLFITGTDTDIGKTIVTAGLVATLQQDYKTTVMKPVQSGAAKKEGKLIAPDIDFVKKMVDLEEDEQLVNPILLKEPLAPSLAAKLEEREVDLEAIDQAYRSLQVENDLVVVEGAGGMIVPIRDDYLISDLIQRLDLPIIIVARPNLGTINHTCLTVEYAREQGIDIVGIIINGLQEVGIAEKTNPRIIEELTGLPVLGVLPWIEELEENREEFIRVFKEEIDLDYIKDYLVL